jgi:ATP-dependent Lon protease
MLPARNQKEMDEIPEDARRQLQFVWLNNVNEAVQFSLDRPGPRAAAEALPEAKPPLPRFPAEREGPPPPVARH